MAEHGGAQVTRSVLRGESVEYSVDTCIHELFEKKAAELTDSTAVIFSDSALNYGQLNRAANQLAHYLMEKHKVQPGACIGLCAERSFELVIGVLGILKAGCAYVPLDPSYPQERLEWIAQKANLQVVLSQQKTVSLLGNLQRLIVAIDKRGNVEDEFSQYSDSDPGKTRVGVRSDDPAYVMFTSGSTGMPKGVLTSHRALHNRIHWMDRTYSCRYDDVVLQKTPYSFDVSVWEILWPLVTGGKLLLAKPNGHGDPAYLVSLINEYSVTKLHFVPSMFGLMLDHGGIAGCTSIKQVFCSGEALSRTHVQRFRASLPTAELHNLYGPTEAAIDVSFWDCSQKVDSSVPIGKPIQNIQLWVLDKALEPTDVGSPGELHISGDGLASGYLNEPELTKQRFITNPHYDGVDASTFKTLYKTGDLVRVLPCGSLEYLGRLDEQVKVRGFRVELREIEIVLEKMEAVDRAVVTLNADQQTLIAHIMLDKGGMAQLAMPYASSIQTYLKTRLPFYMVPTLYRFRDFFPLSKNGKVDRKALALDIGSANSDLDDKGSPEGPTERQLCTIIAKFLGLPGVTPYENFHLLGGDSIKAQQIAFEVRRLGFIASADRLIVSNIIKDFCDSVEVVGPDEQSIPESDGPFPATPLQKRMLFQTLIGSRKEVNIEQISFTLCRYDSGRFRHAVEKLVALHPALLASVQLTKSGILIDTRQQRRLQIKELEIDAGFSLEEAIQKDAEKGFDVSASALFRAKVFVDNEGSADIIFTFHHAVTDGWSSTLLLNDFLSLYSGETINRKEALDYGAYVRFLSHRKARLQTESEVFWNNYLSRSELPAKDFLKARPDAVSELYHREDFPIEQSLKNAAAGYSRGRNLALNTVFQYAWARTVVQIEGSQEAHFSSVVSNRYEDILGIETLHGLCINILPCRVRFDNEHDDGQRLSQLEEDIQKVRQYGYESIEDVRQYGNLPARYEKRLWSLYIFQNYPIVRSETTITTPQNHWYSSQPLCIMVFQGGEPRIEISYSSKYFSSSQICDLVSDFKENIRYICGSEVPQI